MYLGIADNSALVYEGTSSMPERPAVPTPTVTQAKLIGEPADWSRLAGGIKNDPHTWVPASSMPEARRFLADLQPRQAGEPTDAAPTVQRFNARAPQLSVITEAEAQNPTLHGEGPAQ